MPIIKKLVLTPQQLAQLSKTRNNAVVKQTAEEKFQQVLKAHHIKHKTKLRKFHFQAIEDEITGKLVLFDGIGKKYKEFENDFHGQRECRVFALYELFLKTPEEKRQGGYKIDFC